MNYKVFILFAIMLLFCGLIITHSNFEDDSNVNSDLLAIMVFDESINDYVPTSTFPKGSYALNTEKSSCDNDSDIGTYDSENGIINFKSGKSDKCRYYFDIKKSYAVTSVDVTYNYYNADLIVNYNHAGNGEKYYYLIQHTKAPNTHYFESSSNQQTIPTVNNEDMELWIYVDDDANINVYHKTLYYENNEVHQLNCSSQSLPLPTADSDVLFDEIMCQKDYLITSSKIYLKKYDSSTNTYSYIEPNIIELD